MKQKVLICGATGFLGRNLLESFSKNDSYEVRAVWHKSTDLTDVYRDGVEWIHADLTKHHNVKDVFYGGVDIVLQYAGVTSGVKDIVSQPYIHVTDNAIMNSLLMREAFQNEIKHFVFPSCTLMYQSSDKLLREVDVDENDDIYEKYYGAGNTKLYLEKICKFYSSFGKTKFSVLRQSNVYGKYDKFDLQKSHVFGATIVKVVDAFDSISVWGTGEEKRDLLYVDDLVDCVHSVIEKQESDYELINVGCGEAISVSNLVQKIVDIYNKDIRIDYDESKPTVKTKLALDITKAKELFDWYPKTSLENGIRHTLNWYKQSKML
jgi:nucleoside-diphosphate-sugar epimerase